MPSLTSLPLCFTLTLHSLNPLFSLTPIISSNIFMQTFLYYLYTLFYLLSLLCSPILSFPKSKLLQIYYITSNYILPNITTYYLVLPAFLFIPQFYLLYVTCIKTQPTKYKLLCKQYIISELVHWSIADHKFTF